MTIDLPPIPTDQVVLIDPKTGRLTAAGRLFFVKLFEALKAATP